MASAVASTSRATDTFPPLHRADVLACAFSSWYPSFKKVSPKATILRPLAPDFIAYLESDRVFLPVGSGPMGISQLSDSEDGNASDASDDESWQTSFPELDAQIREAITKYDGAVFPKLNWSSPKDAEWMVAGPPLKCQTPADVYLLLKSSDFIAHDLDHAFEGCVDEVLATEDGLVDATAQLDLNAGEGSPPAARERGFEFELVLKKWFDMPQSQEWRCFVRDQQLIGITQRDTNYYEFLQSEESQTNVKEKIEDFFDAEISPRFPSTSYTFDVYISKDNTRVFLIDFNPYGPQTDALLFSWDDLHTIADAFDPSSSLTTVRVISSTIQASQSMPSYSHNRFPADVVNLSSGASIAEFAKEWQTVLEQGVKDTMDMDDDVGR